MKTLLISATMLALAGASAVSAQPAERLSDSQFIKASRCKGVAKAQGGDTKGVDQLLKVNRQGRADFIVDRATSAQDKAQSDFKRADDTGKAQLLSACQAFGIQG